MTFQKTKLALGIATATFTLTGMMVAPEAMAHKSSKKHYHDTHYYGTGHKHKAKPVSVVSSSSSEVSALRAQVDQLKATVDSLQAQVGNKSDNSAKVQELDAWMAQVKAAPVKVETKDNMVFFRGGYGHSNRDRNGVSIQSDVVGSPNPVVNGLVNGEIADKSAWYMGAGFDFSLDDNLFGLSDGTEVMAELMFDYKEFQTVGGNALTNTNNIVVTGAAGGLASLPAGLGGVGNGLNSTTASPTVAAVAGAGAIGNASGSARAVTVNQLTLAASPKIKFMKGSDFRPWIQPVGFALQVVSPPTESITVLQPAMMFGVGADYKLWKNIYVGADARYHYGLGGTMDGVKTDGFTAGGYLGLGF